MGLNDDEIRCWDGDGKEQYMEDVARFDSWEKCRKEKRFPNGLIEFLSSDRGCGFPAPTSIQSFAWPALLQGQDVVGIAKTGSGKTLAFLLPAFMWMKKNKKSANPVDYNVGPAVLVLTPTRELCFQIFSDAQKFGEPVQITAACCYGGAPKRDQEWELQKGPMCLIATPGRLNDFAKSSTVKFDMVHYVTLDEADRMLDMGFEPQIKEVLDYVPNKRQTSMFTATWNKEVREIADRYITSPVVVQVGSDEVTSNKNITQHIEIATSKEEKMEALKRILGGLGDSGNCLVFCGKKVTCKDLCWEMYSSEWSPAELHGDLDQAKRDDALNKFRSGEARVLFATDVAARGLDIRNVTIVVNWDAPNSGDDYIHRIGRTGRANDKGDAYTLMDAWGKEKIAASIKEIMQKAEQEVPECLLKLCGEDTGSSWDNKEEDKWWEKDEKKEESWDKQEESWDKKEDDKWWEKEEKKEESWEKKDDDKWWEKKEETSWDDKSEWDSGKKHDLENAEDFGPPAKKANTDMSTAEVEELLGQCRGKELPVQQLKKWLESKDLPTEGLKSALVERAQEAYADMAK
mmetsp:Transcript_10375/g.17166  ORF Transcript_10375/g.17166 Transcript_10375/m.17166 type:complete len:574 (-) Transcript_10375:94-1815(-)